MAEFILELYSEEIPPQLQINARNELKQIFEKSIEEEGLKYKALKIYSSPTRLTLFIQNLSEKVKILSKEIKGPKVGVSDNILENFINAQKVNKKDVFEKAKLFDNKGFFGINSDVMTQEEFDNFLEERRTHH